MAISVWQVTGDGEAAAFEGWALVAIYVIVAVVARTSEARADEEVQR